MVDGRPEIRLLVSEISSNLHANWVAPNGTPHQRVPALFTSIHVARAYNFHPPRQKGPAEFARVSFISAKWKILEVLECQR